MAIELELTPLNVIAASFGTFLLAYGAVSHAVKERLYLGEAPFALLFGIALQHYGLPGELKGRPGHGADPLDGFGLGLSRFIIGTQLVLVGVQLPYKYPKTEWRSLAMLLLPVMTLMWGMTTLVTWLTLPDVPVLVALVIAAAVTPTDPVLSSAIVKGSFADQYVSPRIRNLISAESGANDGFALPFMFIAASLLKEDTPGAALKSWVLETCLWSVMGSVVFGAAVGFGANRLLQFAASKHLIDKESFLLYAVALGVLIVGLGGILATDDLLACFVAGNTLTWDDWYRRETEEDELQNVTDLICNSVFFTFVGATVPWSAFNDPALGLTHGNLALLCVGVLFLRRVPAMMLFYRAIPQIADSGEALFMGWMAPIGAGSIFYTFLILEEFKPSSEQEDDLRIRALVKPVIYALVLSSIIAHTLMVPVIKLGFEALGIESIKMYEPAPGEGSLAGGNESVEQAEDDAYEAGAGPAPGTHEQTHGSRLSQYSEGAQQAAAEHGAYLSSGKYDPHPSWRISSGHKLGPHVVKRGPDGSEQQQHDFQPSAWQRNRMSRASRTSLRGAPSGADYGSLEDGGGGGGH